MERFIIDRYLRHQSIKWLNQEDLFKKNVLIVGMGAIGNELLKNMVLLGIGNISIIDYDKIEIHNLTRSVLFREEDIGKSKVEIAKNRAKELNPDTRIKIQTYNDDFYNIIDFKFLNQFDAVFSAVDNFEARIKLHRLCFLSKVDFYNAGIDSQFVNVEYYPYKNFLSTYSCFECNLNEKIYQNIQKKYSCGWIERSAKIMNKIPTTIITSSIASSIMLSCFLRKDLHHEPIKIFIDTFNFNLTKTNLQKNKECYFCSNWNNIKEMNWGEFIHQLKHLPEDLTFFLNEPILISTRCKNCKKIHYLWDLSRKYKDSDLICSYCFNETEPEVRDYFFKKEIANLQSLKFKYLYYFDINDPSTILIKKV
jgi:molybdopterin/thiamine biosynthesis adenylyltransferase